MSSRLNCKQAFSLLILFFLLSPYSIFGASKTERIVYVVETVEGDFGSRDIWSMNTDGTDRRPLIDDPGWQMSASVSQDGRYLKYSDQGSGAVLFDLVTGEKKIAWGQFSSPTWLPNEDEIFQGAETTSIELVNLSTGSTDQADIAVIDQTPLVAFPTTAQDAKPARPTEEHPGTAWTVFDKPQVPAVTARGVQVNGVGGTIATGTIVGWPESGDEFIFDDFVTVTSDIQGWWSLNTLSQQLGWFYAYNFPTTEIAHAPGVTEISEVTDASAFAYEMVYSTGPVGVGEFVFFRNLESGFYAAFRVDNVYGPSAVEALADITWYLQMNGTADFSSMSNENPCQGFSTSCGSVESGNINANDCDDGPKGENSLWFTEFYNFNVGQGELVNLNTTNGVGTDQGWIYLIDPSDSIIAGGVSVDGVEIQQSGTHTIWVSTFVQGATGSYELNVECETPIDPPVIVSFAANPDSILEGESTTLSWSVSNADSCTPSGGAGGWSGSTISLPSDNVQITLSEAGTYTFFLDCSNATSSDSASAMVDVDELITNPGELNFHAFIAIEEGDGNNGKVQVTRTGGADGAVSVDYFTSDGTAMCDLDYECTSGTLEWDDGDDFFKEFEVQIYDDDIYEGSEYFNVHLTNPTGGAVIGELDTAEYWIPDNELPPAVVIDSFAADPDSLIEGETITISWSVGNADSCTASGGTDSWAGSSISLPSESLQITLSEAGTYTFFLDCSNATSSDSASTMVTVEPSSGTDCTSRSIGCEQSRSGDLSTSDCTSGPQGPGHYAEKLTYNGEVGDRLFLDANWSLDGYLLLEGPNGLIVVQNDNHTGSSNSRIEHEVQQNGTYTIWATTFAPGATGSFDVSLSCESPSGPDLTVLAPDVGSGLLVPGQSITVAATLRNLGDQDSDSTTLRYLLSSDNQIDLLDAQMGSDGAPALAVGGSSAQSLSFTAPATPGSYYLGVCADAVPAESSLSNNCSTGTHITVNDRPECTRLGLSCGQFLSENELSVSDCTGSPRGEGFLSEVLEFNVSSGSELVIDATWQGLDGYLLLEGPSGALVAENDDGGSGSRIEYKAAQNGVHRLWATGFQRNATGSYSVDLLCGASSAPDLQSSTARVDVDDISINQTIGISATVVNDGNAGSTATQVKFMRSTNETITPLDTVMTTRSFEALSAGASRTVQATVEAPSNPGNYWVGVCVEPVNNETLADNNCSHITEVTNASAVQQVGAEVGKIRPQPQGIEKKGTLIVVSNGIECLQNTQLSCGDTRSGELSQSDCDLSPRGTGYPSDLYLFNGTAGDMVSLNVNWDGVDGYLYLVDPDGVVTVENDDFLDQTQSRFEQVLDRTGRYQVWPAAFFKMGTLGSYELQLTCNATSAPDLVVETPQLSDATVRPGQSVTVSTQVSNAGNGAAQATRVEFVLASSATLSANDRVLGTTDVAVLNIGDSSNETLSVALNVTPGTYYLGICVDADTTELDTDNNCAVSGPITVEQTNEPIPINPGLNDAWYNPDTSGQGFFINVFPDTDQVFLSWFTFDTERPASDITAQLGEPGHRWLTAQGTYERGVATLVVFLTEGGVFDAGQPPAVTDQVPYGSMTVSFTDCNHGEVAFDLPAVNESGTVPITRILPDNVSDCEDQIGAVASRAVTMLEEVSHIEMAGSTPKPEAEGDGSSTFKLNPSVNDAWFNPLTAGQGFFFNVYPEREFVFLSWFTFDVTRPPDNTPHKLGEPGHRWLTAQGGFLGDTAELDVFITEGGVFNAGQPPAVTDQTPYGSMTVSFTDCNSGVVTYDISSIGRRSEVPIERIVRDSIPACEQKSKGDESAQAVRPKNKELMPNQCRGSVDWQFDWPDEDRAGAYIFQLQRDDNLTITSWVKTITKASDYEYQKAKAIPENHLSGWRWRYKPLFTGPGKGATGWSEYFTFNVVSMESADPCLN